MAGSQLNKVTPGRQREIIARLEVGDCRSVDPQPTRRPANGDELPDLDNPIVASRPTIERVAYFVSLTGLTYPTTDGQVAGELSLSVNTPSLSWCRPAATRWSVPAIRHQQQSDLYRL